MQTVNIHEAKTHLSRFVDQAAAGEEILIARAGKPIARLVALTQVDLKPRTLGQGRGKFTLPNDFPACMTKPSSACSKAKHEHGRAKVAAGYQRSAGCADQT